MLANTPSVQARVPLSAIMRCNMCASPCFGRKKVTEGPPSGQRKQSFVARKELIPEGASSISPQPSRTQIRYSILTPDDDALQHQLRKSHRLSSTHKISTIEHYPSHSSPGDGARNCAADSPAALPESRPEAVSTIIAGFAPARETSLPQRRSASCLCANDTSVKCIP